MLELRNVGYETDDNKEILHDVSLTVQERFVAITGPNGGQILLDGVDITHMSITERANLGLSYAFQQPVRFKGLRVKDLLSLAADKIVVVKEGHIQKEGPRSEILPALLGSADASSPACSVLTDKVEGVRN